MEWWKWLPLFPVLLSSVLTRKLYGHMVDNLHWCTHSEWLCQLHPLHLVKHPTPFECFIIRRQAHMPPSASSSLLFLLLLELRCCRSGLALTLIILVLMAFHLPVILWRLENRDLSWTREWVLSYSVCNSRKHNKFWQSIEYDMIMNVNIMCPPLPTERKVVLDYSYTQAPCNFYLLLSLSSLFPGLTSALAQLHPYISSFFFQHCSETRLQFSGLHILSIRRLTSDGTSLS